MKAFRLITPYLHRRRWFILTGIVCLITVDILQLCIPRVIKWTIDDLTASRIDASGLWRYALTIVALALAIGVFRYIWRRCLIGTSRWVEEGLRNRLFEHLQHLSAPFFDRTSTGDLMAHATNDIQHVRMATGMGIVALTDAVVLGSAALAFMLYINVQLTLLVMIPMPLIVFGTRFFSRRMHRLYGQVQESFADLTEIVRERLAAIRVIKAYTREEEAVAQIAATSQAYVTQNLKLVRITGAFFPMMVLFTNISLTIVIYWGGRLTILAEITPGDFVAFIAYLGLMAWPMMAMGWVANLIQRGRASLERIDRILQTPPDVVEAPRATVLAPAPQPLTLQLDRISFSYPVNQQRERLPAALSDISLTVNPGHLLGIVGPPGSGKTTLIRLLPRFYDVDQGRIVINDHDIHQLALEPLRSHMVYVPQEPFLFAGTIRANLQVANPEADDETLMQAARQAALSKTIHAFPKGLDTIVGEKGIILSGGQKQRIALARALLRKASLVLLDDPISQVDAATAQTIAKTLYQLKSQCTMVMASHRLATLREAEEIIVLQKGRISERGTYDQLCRQQGYFATTARLQALQGELDAD
jgi:ATP-binding cassette subfamily B protein